MEDGVKEDPAQSKEPKFLGKAGWVKKAHGRVLASYKDRFIHVERTEIVVYENEDLQNCLERLDLENYDKCHELKSPFKKKHRLILIRSPKSANKVHDLKFQAQTAEEKEAWIKALSDGINRAKNKIFDEVKIDESCNLEHVTRTRPKGNRNRRPPTRIHMKEVAGVSSDGILRLDLDLENAIMPNGTHHLSVDGTEKDKTPTPSSNDGDTAFKESEQTPEEETQTEPQVSSEKKIIKPPMPPIKEAKPSSPTEDKPEKEDGSEKKVLKPPMPPSKEVKPSVSPKEEASQEEKAEKIPEKSPDARKKTGPPPTPPNKPSTNSSTSNLTEASESRPDSHPPTPPSKEKKPSCPAKEVGSEVQGSTDESEEKAEESEEEGTAEAEPSIYKEDEDPESPTAERVSEEDTEEADHEPKTSTEPVGQSPTPPLVPKKKPEKSPPPNDDENLNAPLHDARDTSANSPQTEEEPPKSGVPTVVVSLNDPVTDSLGLSPLLAHFPGEKKKKAEEKSVDSGQHSDDDSEASGSEDTLAASTAALRGSNAGLDVLDASEDDIQVSVSLRHPQVASKPLVQSKAFPFRRSVPTPPLKPSAKARSASFGNLLSDSSVGQQTTAGAGSKATPGDDVIKLEAEVALEMEKTQELLSKVSDGGGDKELRSEDLLTKAMEKLKKADHVLREAKKLTPAKNSSFRKSW
ncbi:pleckstrin homology domain-containing family O member 2 [Cheilinus undulatus]|uniref:pleckstrin homology domain-containing family O member 2 n=1 Tax=Cheilinus undulatus TaxID=241271 RepID=UPI001BD4F681|nr:pleckstrin homology domain-containing family O member 2 [Cheilinus undulatus]